MFNLDNIDLEFDEDFSSNIFTKKANIHKKDAKDGEVQERITPNTSKNDSLDSSPIQQTQHNNSEKSIHNIFNSPLFSTPRENTLKRPHNQDDKPQKKRLSRDGLVERRFPGPAGLLPDRPFREIAELSIFMEKPEEEDSPEKEKPVVLSQCSGSVFLDSGYQKLVTDFNLNDVKNPLNKYTVEWVKKKALSKGLQGRKIPFLGLVIHEVNHSMPDPMLVLRDPTGEIIGSLHREVWAEMGGKLRSGIALAVRQVGVLITGVIRRQIYLNITMNNILAIYSCSENESEVETTTVNKLSKAELFKSFSEWLQPAKTTTTTTTTSPKPSPPIFPFTTIDSNRSPVIEIKNLKNTAQSSRNVLNDLGIVLNDGDFTEEMKVPEPVPEKKRGVVTSTQVLSQAESLIFEEVLSGIDLDEFEM